MNGSSWTSSSSFPCKPASCSSPLISKRKLVKSIMENSYHDASVFSEEAKQLKQFLLELECGHESQSVLKDIERFIFDPETRWKLKQDDISNRRSPGRFLLGDTECNGFLHHCFQVKQGCHYFCCLYLETLNKITSKSFNPNSDKYLKILSCLPLAKLKQLQIGAHIDSAGLRRCKEAAFEFISLLERVSPRTNYSSLFTSAKSKAAFDAWKSKKDLFLSPQVEDEASTDLSPVVPYLTVPGVFGQQLSPADLITKKRKFLADSRADFQIDGQEASAIKVVSDIVNFDMAVLHSTVPIPPDFFHSPSAEEGLPLRVSHSTIDPEIRERLRQAVHHGAEGATLKPSSENSEAVVLQLFKDGVVEIRIKHHQTTFVLKVKCTADGERVWSSPGTIASFSFAPATTASNQQEASRTIQIEETCERKISLDSAICDFGWSNSSTVAGSESGQATKSTRATPCSLSGELAFETDSRKAGQGKSVAALRLNLFLAAEDKASTAILQALPDIKHLVNTAIVESFFLLAKC